MLFSLLKSNFLLQRLKNWAAIHHKVMESKYRLQLREKRSFREGTKMQTVLGCKRSKQKVQKTQTTGEIWWCPWLDLSLQLLRLYLSGPNLTQQFFSKGKLEDSVECQPLPPDSTGGGCTWTSVLPGKSFNIAEYHCVNLWLQSRGVFAAPFVQCLVCLKFSLVCVVQNCCKNVGL